MMFRSLFKFQIVAAFGMTLVWSLNSGLSFAQSAKDLESIPPGYGQGVQKAPAPLAEIGIKEYLGKKIPVESVQLFDEEGKSVSVAKFFDGRRPVILTFVYFGCPGICGPLLMGVTNALRRMDWTMGNQYEHVVVSINPKEDFTLAKAKKDNYLKEYGRLEAAPGWHFLTGTEEQVRKLANEVGFGYKYMEETGEYAHSAGIFILTPNAVLSRILYGVEFEPRNVRLGLLEASEGKVGSIVDRLLLFCYRYDPNSKGYAFYAMNLVKLASFFMAVLMAIYFSIFWRKERRRIKLETENGKL